MGKLYDTLSKDIRFIEGISACINCGTCTAICPAAEVYNYQPRAILDAVQGKNEEAIEAYLKSDTIWYCGECMSCKTRCPRQNAPGLVIQALRTLSIEMGYFVESEKGRQQLALKRMVGESILDTGYCVYIDHIDTESFPEQGPVWDWLRDNAEQILPKMGANYKGEGPGALRKVPQEDLDELRSIFEVTGGMAWFDTIEEHSARKAKEMGLEIGTGKDSEYFYEVFNTNNQEKHTNS
ncbi:4Fe-4S dicluster domain-containing protein [Williamwhitmania taraxaci]|uniref:Heterodisulfide reductase subunit C n=1 Tax=Williamwhitmania taraxaci TaxID=1640674 RepID=A0A1G6GV43_9BACT|nr:4Fe-4S dicluster domain-containing protein [Williamwhitmania taraxaci]SDB85849.1 heterodisulfide reductase subunit C [Williamwhitmania taraxaci]